MFQRPDRKHPSVEDDLLRKYKLAASGCNHPATATSLDRHVAQRHASFHGQCATGPSAEFDGMALRSIGADMRDDCESDVLCTDPDRGGESTMMRMRFGFFCQRVCVIRTCATSDAPIPKAYAPKAP